jgi:hypothetical protein
MSQNACDEPIIVPPGPGKGIVGSGSLGIVPKTGTYVTTWTNPNIGNPIDGEKFLTPTTVISVGYVIPNGVVEIGPVANTSNFPTVDANGNVDYVAFAEQMQSDAQAIVSQLQSLQASKAAAIAAIPDGPSCNTNFEILADTFLVNCNAMTVDACDGDKPDVTFNCGDFTITMNSTGETFTVTNGVASITLTGTTLSFSGITTMDLPAGTTIGGDSISTGLESHRHTYGIPGDSNTYNTGYTGS